MKRSLLPILTLLLTCIVIQAREYHVSEKGNDSNEGSVTAPFRTINKAAQAAYPGDIVTDRKSVV